MNLNEIDDLLRENQEDKLLDYLKHSYKIKINANSGEPERLNATVAEVQKILDIMQNAFKSSNHLLLKESFRCLRNCIIKNGDIQGKIFTLDTNLLETSQDILVGDPFPIDLKNMLLTFLINLSIENKCNADIIWNEMDIHTLMKKKSISFKLYALVYNILYYCNKATTGLQFLMNLLTTIEENESEETINEFAHFILDLLIENGNVFQYYGGIRVAEHRIEILKHLKELQLKKRIANWSKENLTIITTHFKQKSDCILKTVADYVDKIEPYEVSLLADVIASMSSDEQCLTVMQYDRSLLINCAFLLKSMHNAGKEGNRHFVPISKLSQTEDSQEILENHPAFGFKVNMIRILGNLAWKMQCNQDDMRELDVIPLLLDCCNIDGRNPFIVQWVVFAIRNICENNVKNQEVIASMNRQGVVDATMLTELGLTLHDDGANTISIAPLSLN